MTRHIAIVGGGFSGTLLAIQLARLGARATLIDRAATPGLGVAYATAQPSHLLNVRAGNMSAFADEPAHFADWLSKRGVADAAHQFVARMTYGEYLRGALATAQAELSDRLRVIAGNATDIDFGAGVTVSIADHAPVAADDAVLAIGNLPPATPPGLARVVASPRYFADPWDPALSVGLAGNDHVLLVGTGLTTIDTVLTLAETGFTGQITAQSRRGLLPRAHADAIAFEARGAAPAGRLSRVIREVRARAESIGWRAAVDELRPFTQAIWAAAEPIERKRFLSRLRPWWDVHRHRIAPAVADQVAALIASARLNIVAAEITQASETPAGIEVSYRRRGQSDSERAVYQRIVNCTGPLQDIARSDDSLLSALQMRGAISPDDLHTGIAVIAIGATIGRDGSPVDRLWAVGPLTRGALWEIVAVPDIRRQVHALAERLAAA